LSRCRWRSPAGALSVTGSASGVREPSMRATVARFPAPIRSRGLFVSVLALIRFELDTLRRRLVTLPGRWRSSAVALGDRSAAVPVGRGAPQRRSGVAASSAGWSGVVIRRRARASWGSTTEVPVRAPQASVANRVHSQRP
jgi:hypothetical protein